MARKQLGTASAAAGDLITRGEVQALIAAANAASTAFPMVVRPPIGRYLTMAGVTSTGSAGMTSGRLRMAPIWVPPPGMTADAFRFRITTAQSGGATSYEVRLYRSNADGYPDFAGSPVGSATITLTAGTGNNGSDFNFAAGAQALTPGLYWICDLYIVTTTPTTVAQSQNYQQTAIGFPTDTNNAPDALARSFKLEGRTAFPTAAVDPATFDIFKGNESPLILLRRSA